MLPCMLGPSFPPPHPPPPDRRTTHQTNTNPHQPAVAFFNVGELAADALIATLGAPLAGRLGDPNLLPVAGNDAFDHAGAAGELATALELYSAGEVD
jgi:hypothetical protein